MDVTTVEERQIVPAQQHWMPDNGATPDIATAQATREVSAALTPVGWFGGNIGGARYKRQLITEALGQLREAHESDERGDAAVADWLLWYDSTMNDCDQITSVVGAMRIECANRRGEVVIAQGELRGGVRGQGETLPHFDGAQKAQRVVDRTIAENPAAVKEYVRELVKSGRVPSIRGALKVARKASAKKAYTKKSAKVVKLPIPDLRAKVRDWIPQMRSFSERLADPAVIEYLDGEPELAKEFRAAATELAMALDKFSVGNTPNPASVGH